MDKMEIKIGDFGRMIFEMCLERKHGHMPDHWKSILPDALPLVKALLDLNDKMPGGGYTIVGIVKEGKRIRSKSQRIGLAMCRAWQVRASTLVKGDRVWLHKDDEIPMEPLFDSPVAVEMIHEGRILVSHPQGRRAGVYEVGACDDVLKAPPDWEDNEEYRSEQYWLKKADEDDL
jgi:hypothetical protein